MTAQLLEETFEKARIASGKDSVHGRAEFLSEYMLEKFRYSVSGKSLTRYFKGESVPGKEVRDHLSVFLGYENYEAFVLTTAPENTKPSEEKMISTGYVPKKSLLTFLLIVPLIGISAYVGYLSGEEKCMIWQGDHYEETRCTGAALEREYIRHLYSNFRKTEVSDTTTFFRNGQPQVWYDKSNNELEFFTAPGIHPENGKTLKPITRYMIDKYIKNNE